MKRSPWFVTTVAMAFALGLGTVFALPNATFAMQTPECPTDTTFVAKYDLPNLESPSEGTDVITFSDLQVVGNELKRFDFISDVPIAYVYVKAGSEAGDSGNYDYRISPVTSGNDLLTPTGKGVSHISFCGPLPPTNGALQVTKYNDLNGNGSRDSGEPTLSGWSFAVRTATGASAGVITTDTSGSGTLSDLAPGTYNVIETLTSDWENTDPGTTTPTKSATVVAGQTASLVFGNKALPTTGAIKVSKYNDINGNGAQDAGEPTLEGWSFSVRTAAGGSVGTITTDTSGSGTLSGLAPGGYNVIETLAAGWQSTDPSDGTLTKTTTVVPGGTHELVFGNRAVPTLGSITVTKYNDLDGDGTRDDGEPALAGWSFSVQPPEGPPLGPIVTDGSGSGTLSGLMAGAYSVIETLRQGWEGTDPADGTLTKTTTVVAGQASNLVFGNRALPTTGTIHVTKYNDRNGNGSRDEGEPALEGWTFTLHDGVEVTFAQLATGTDGTVTFSGLEPRTYYVSETMSSGWINTDPAGAPTKTTTVVAGQTQNLLFGNHALPTTGAVAVTKYNDLDQNGAQDSGEPLLEGWSFEVRNAAGASAGTITTDASGSGTLSGLAPGVYTVIETPQTNWHNTDPAGGTLTKTATVVAGQTAPLVFGNHFAAPPPPPPPPPVPGRLTVVKYHDIDRDGALDQDEPLLSGWTFSVMSGNAIVHTLVTGADGSASVTLNDGTYSVLETQQILWTSTDPGGAAPAKGVQIGPGSAVTVLFGNAHVLLPPTSETVLTIVKYHDANANGARELTEPVLSGFSFLIRDASGAMVRTATTDDSGMAVVTNLPLGVYMIVEQASAGWYNTDPGGAAMRPAMLSENALGATVIFGNTTVRLPSTARLPSTSTDNGTTGTLLAVILGLAILSGMGFGAFRYRMR